MKINNLSITNFRGIRKLEAKDLGDTIIISGQNGSGKSCIFDAIRLIKSSYGGYQQNEWQQFFGEFAIQLQGGIAQLRGLFNDLTKPVIIEVHFSLRDDENAYVHANAIELLEETIWQTVLPEAFQFGGYRKALFAAQFRDRQPEVTKRVTEQLPTLLSELAKPETVAKLTIQTTGAVEIEDSVLLSLLFSNYRPRDIGVIDFHGAQRHYGREFVQGINLNLDQFDQNQRAHSLYNYSNKYQNVKSEMAANYIKELLAEKAAEVKSEEFVSLSNTLKALFKRFFPDKEFLGPIPRKDGSLGFPVRTKSGNEHDLDELSSGEKEILYGYLRIRNSAPKNSIILLDEPELHLNPRLIRGLPEFYRQHLGEELKNQLWLVTHSDALIREAVGKPGFNVFHMLPCGAETDGSSQLKALSVSDDLNAAVTDLVGDLAAYHPGGRGIIFEGGGDSDYDKTLVSTLFAPELVGYNLISGSNKSRVRHLHDVLEKAHRQGDLETRFFAITDRDSGMDTEESSAVGRYQWDVYHIENYLLETKYVAKALMSLELKKAWTESDVEKRLKAAAREVVSAVLAERMRAFVNSQMVQCIKLGFAPDTTAIGIDLHNAASRSMERIGKTLAAELSLDQLVQKEALFRTDIEQSFATGRWRSDLPGRDILRRFCASPDITVGYEILRNLIANKMADEGYKPVGMHSIIRKIVTS